MEVQRVDHRAVIEASLVGRPDEGSPCQRCETKPWYMWVPRASGDVLGRRVALCVACYVARCHERAKGEEAKVQHAILMPLAKRERAFRQAVPA